MKVPKAKKSQLCCFRNRFRCVGVCFLLHWHKILVKHDWITKFEKNPSAASADRPLQRNPVFWAFWGPQTYPRASGAQFLHSHHLRHQANPISHKKNHAQIFFAQARSLLPKQFELKLSYFYLKLIWWNWSLLPLNTISWPGIVISSQMGPNIPAFFAAIVWTASGILLTFRSTCWHIMYLITN